MYYEFQPLNSMIDNQYPIIVPENSNLSVQQLMAFMHNFPMPVLLINKEGNIIHGNREMCKLFEYSEEEIKETSVINLIENISLKEWEDHWLHLQERKSLDLYNSHISKTGKRLELEIFANLVQLEGVEYNLVFARLREFDKLVDKRYRKQQEFFSILTDNVSEILWVMDVETEKFRYVSKSVEKILEYSPEEIIGLTPNDIIVKEVQELKRNNMLANLEKYLKNECDNFTDEVPHVTKSGRVIIGEIRTRFYENPETGKLEIVGVTTDITKRKQTEDELQVKNKDLEALSKTKDKFISIISHDLRGPIFSFVQLTEMLSSGMRSMPFKEVQDALRKMNRSAINIASLLENLLNWSRLQQGRIAVSKTPLNLAESLEEIWNMSLELASQKGIIMHNLLPNNLTLVTDEKMLQTILRNLLSNAIKFTHPAKKISLSLCNQDSGSITLCVEDEGIGMNAEQIKSVLDNTLKAGKKGVQGEPGSGIGLLLCREFIDMLEGRFSIESELGKGSKFKVTLPLK